MKQFLLYIQVDVNIAYNNSNKLNNYWYAKNHQKKLLNVKI